MRLAVTFAVSGKNFRLVHGPEVPLLEQRAAFKRAVLNPPAGVDGMEIWTNESRINRKKFAPILDVIDSRTSAKNPKSKIS